MENLQIQLRLLKARLKAQKFFSLNIEMQTQAAITEAEINELEMIISEQENKKDKISQKRELLIDFLTWNTGDEHSKLPEGLDEIVEIYLKN